MAAIIIFALAVITAGAAIWLLIYSDARTRRDEVNLRLRAGDDPLHAAQVLRDKRLGNPVLRWACHIMWRAGSEAEPETVAKVLWVLAGMIPVTFLIFGPFRGFLVFGLLLAFGYGILRRQAAQRRALIVSQMPGFLEAGLRVLQAGNTLEESLALAAADSPDPIKPLFLSVGRQVRLGAPLDQVLVEAAEIHGVRDIKVMALAASINRRYGGSLRNLFRSLIQAIRSRDSAARELRALTAETRLSAIVLSVMPALITLVLFFQNPQFYTAMWASPGGRIALIVAGSMQVAGVAIIYRMMATTEDTD
jgi:tight adherence protein B